MAGSGLLWFFQPEKFVYVIIWIWPGSGDMTFYFLTKLTEKGQLGADVQ